MSKVLERNQLLKKEEELLDKVIREHHREVVVVKLMDLFLEISLKRSMGKSD